MARRRRITRHDRAVDRYNMEHYAEPARHRSRRRRRTHHTRRRSESRASFNRKHPRNRFGEFIRKR